MSERIANMNYLKANYFSRIDDLDETSKVFRLMREPKSAAARRRHAENVDIRLFSSSPEE
jgi:hypothetical protein